MRARILILALFCCIGFGARVASAGDLRFEILNQLGFNSFRDRLEVVGGPHGFGEVWYNPKNGVFKEKVATFKFNPRTNEVRPGSIERTRFVVPPPVRGEVHGDEPQTWAEKQRIAFDALNSYHKARDARLAKLPWWKRLFAL